MGAVPALVSRSSVVPSSMITTYSALASRLQNMSAGGAAISSDEAAAATHLDAILVEQDEVRSDVCRKQRERHGFEHGNAGAQERECSR